MRRQTLSFLAAILPCAACASVPAPAKLERASERTANATRSSSSPAVRNVFTTKLAAPVAAARAGEGGGAVSKAWGSSRIVVGADNSFEYLITIYNPNAETFTSAHLHRSSSTEEGTVIATLFSDVSLRDRYIQLRGTVSVNRSTKSQVLAEALRERPGLFYISVHSTEEPKGAIRGTIV